MHYYTFSCVKTSSSYKFNQIYTFILKKVLLHSPYTDKSFGCFKMALVQRIVAYHRLAFFLFSFRLASLHLGIMHPHSMLPLSYKFPAVTFFSSFLCTWMLDTLEALSLYFWPSLTNGSSQLQFHMYAIRHIGLHVFKYLTYILRVFAD